jgi:hypothetical protein
MVISIPEAGIIPFHDPTNVRDTLPVTLAGDMVTPLLLPILTIRVHGAMTCVNSVVT